MINRSPEPIGLTSSGRQPTERQLLVQAIEQCWLDLVVDIRVYVWRFGLARERALVEMMAQEILEETVVTALEKSQTYDIARPARPWLRGIAFNHVRHHYRQQNQDRKHVVPVAEVPQVSRAVKESRANLLSEEEMFGLLHAGGGSAPPTQPTLEELLSLVADSDARVLRLAFAKGLRGKVLAAELGLSEGGAAVRLNRAIARLREAYLRGE